MDLKSFKVRKLKSFIVIPDGNLCGECGHLNIYREFITKYYCNVWDKYLKGKEDFNLNECKVDRCIECVKSEKEYLRNENTV